MLKFKIVLKVTRTNCRTAQIYLCICDIYVAWNGKYTKVDPHSGSVQFFCVRNRYFQDYDCDCVTRSRRNDCTEVYLIAISCTIIQPLHVNWPHTNRNYTVNLFWMLLIKLMSSCILFFQVSSIVGRADVLACLFFLGSFILYVR